MESNPWNPPPVPESFYPSTPRRRRRGVVAGVGLLGAGVVAGAIVGSTLLSSAATSSPGAGSAPGAGSSATSAPGMPGMGRGYGRGPGMGLGLTGTVTAIGSSSVTIKTSTATTTYKVGTNSDIDKNGEAKLSDLKVGDSVRFSVETGNVIDKLHAGDEALDRPQGPPPSGSDG